LLIYKEYKFISHRFGGWEVWIKVPADTACCSEDLLQDDTSLLHLLDEMNAVLSHGGRAEGRKGLI
jgi:hypothetical protein